MADIKCSFHLKSLISHLLYNNDGPCVMSDCISKQTFSDRVNSCMVSLLSWRHTSFPADVTHMPFQTQFPVAFSCDTHAFSNPVSCCIFHTSFCPTLHTSLVWVFCLANPSSRLVILAVQ